MIEEGERRPRDDFAVAGIGRVRLKVRRTEQPEQELRPPDKPEERARVVRLVDRVRRPLHGEQRPTTRRGDSRTRKLRARQDDGSIDAPITESGVECHRKRGDAPVGLPGNGDVVRIDEAS